MTRPTNDLASIVTPGFLRAVRILLGMTQDDLAEMLGVFGQETITRWETGKNPIPGPVKAFIVSLLSDRPDLIDRAHGIGPVVVRRGGATRVRKRKGEV